MLTDTRAVPFNTPITILYKIVIIINIISLNYKIWLYSESLKPVLVQVTNRSQHHHHHTDIVLLYDIIHQY
jgi:hypothetical protein